MRRRRRDGARKTKPTWQCGEQNNKIKKITQTQETKKNRLHTISRGKCRELGLNILCVIFWFVVLCFLLFFLFFCVTAGFANLFVVFYCLVWVCGFMRKLWKNPRTSVGTIGGNRGKSVGLGYGLGNFIFNAFSECAKRFFKKGDQ